MISEQEEADERMERLEVEMTRLSQSLHTQLILLTSIANYWAEVKKSLDDLKGVQDHTCLMGQVDLLVQVANERDKLKKENLELREELGKHWRLP